MKTHLCFSALLLLLVIQLSGQSGRQEDVYFNVSIGLFAADGPRYTGPVGTIGSTGYTVDDLAEGDYLMDDTKLYRIDSIDVVSASSVATLWVTYLQGTVGNPSAPQSGRGFVCRPTAVNKLLLMPESGSNFISASQLAKAMNHNVLTLESSMKPDPNHGAVLYVNKTMGNNSIAEKGNPLKPWRDPWAARDAAVAGDLIYVYDSQFTLDWRVTNSGDWSTGSMSLSKDRVKFYFHNVKITNTGSYEPGVVGCGVTNRPFLFTTNSLAYIRDTSSWIKSRRYYVDIKGHNFVLKDMAAFLHVTPNGGADIITGVPAFPLGLPVPDLYVNLEIDSIVMKHSGMVVITGDDINFKGDIKNAVFDGPDIGFSAQSGCLQTNVFTISANPNRTPFDSIRVNLRVDNVYAFMTSYGTRGLFNLHDEITAPSATKFLAQCDLNLDIGKVVYFTNSAAGDIGSLIDFTHAGRYFKSNININIDQAESFMPVQYDSLVKARYVPYLQPNRTTGTMIGFGTPLDSTTVTIHCNQCIAYDNAIQLYDGFGTTHKRGKVVITGNYHSKNFQTVLFDQVVNNASDCDYILSGTFTSDRREVFQCSGTQQSRVLFKNSLLKTYSNFPVIASRKGVFLLDATLEKQAGAEPIIWSDQSVTHTVGSAYFSQTPTDADVSFTKYWGDDNGLISALPLAPVVIDANGNGLRIDNAGSIRMESDNGGSAQSTLVMGPASSIPAQLSHRSTADTTQVAQLVLDWDGTSKIIVQRPFSFEADTFFLGKNNLPIDNSATMLGINASRQVFRKLYDSHASIFASSSMDSLVITNDVFRTVKGWLTFDLKTTDWTLTDTSAIYNGPAGARFEVEYSVSYTGYYTSGDQISEWRINNSGIPSASRTFKAVVNGVTDAINGGCLIAPLVGSQVKLEVGDLDGAIKPVGGHIRIKRL